MTTSTQLPADGDQVSDWVPDPLVCAVQKFWSPGGDDGAPAPVVMAGAEPDPTSVTMVRWTPPR